MKGNQFKLFMLFSLFGAITGMCGTFWLTPSQGGIRGRTVQQINIFERVTNSAPSRGITVFVRLKAEIAVHFASTGQFIAIVRSDENGDFKISLPPGTYDLRPKRIPPGSGNLAPIHPRLEAERRIIRVRRGQFTPVEIRYYMNSAV
jgi:hypothetical protein